MFGLLGNFETDQSNIAIAVSLLTKLGNDEDVSSNEIIEVLRKLPFIGRQQFFNEVVKSSARDRIIRELFVSSFIDSVDDEDVDSFVLVASGNSRTIDTSKIFVLKLIMMVLPQCGSLGVELYRFYENTSSNIFRESLLLNMV